LIVFLLWRRQRKQEEEPRQIDLSNPLRIPAAVSFALAFTVVLIVVQAANEFMGNTGVYLASAITGLVDVDAITLSASGLTASGQLTPNVAASAIILASLVNTATKAVIALFLGVSALRRIIATSFGIVLITGIVAALLALGIL
jgi:uncharacterized membrane protein (DUF4010 family)